MVSEPGSMPDRNIAFCLRKNSIGRINFAAGIAEKRIQKDMGRSATKEAPAFLRNPAWQPPSKNSNDGRFSQNLQNSPKYISLRVYNLAELFQPIQWPIRSGVDS
jgi:hypothetical protein